MLYRIRHVTRFEYARRRLRALQSAAEADPVVGPGIEDYRLTINPSGETSPARAEAGLANVVRLVLERRCAR
jgi:uncharacterized protein YlxW (UPF0749 family)